MRRLLVILVALIFGLGASGEAHRIVTPRRVLRSRMDWIGHPTSDGSTTRARPQSFASSTMLFVPRAPS